MGEPISFSLLDMLSIMGGQLTSVLFQKLNKVEQEKTDYAQKIEKATSGIEISKYLVLMNLSALEGYVTQTRLQAQQSFRLRRVMAIIGFFLLTVGIAIGVYSQMFLQRGLEAAYLSSIAGILTELISGVFFYLYNKTLEQINLFHSALQSSQKIAMSFLMTSIVSDDKQRDTATLESAKLLLSESLADNNRRELTGTSSAQAEKR